jgi:hypothetical protein
VPTSAEVEKCVTKWHTAPEYENYREQEKVIHRLFNDLFPKNDVLEEILCKASVLNDFYSTNIFSIFSVAKHILNLKIDQALSKADTTIVGEIAQITIKGKSKRFYSFASKYCNHHCPNEYPIYDRFVHKILVHFKKRDAFAKFSDDDLKDYPKFKDILLSFKNHYKLDKSLWEIDKYLWMCGKENLKMFSVVRGLNDVSDDDKNPPDPTKRTVNDYFKSVYDELEFDKEYSTEEIKNRVSEIYKNNEHRELNETTRELHMYALTVNNRLRTAHIKTPLREKESLFFLCIK